MTVVEPLPDGGAPPAPRRQGPPEVEALHAIDQLIGNEETITAEQLGEVRGIVLDTLNAWHTRQRADDPGRVAGRCPMGCGETLFLGAGGYVTCSWVGCPRPEAASEILAERDTEHVVELGEHGWSAVHPLAERLDGALLRCDLGEWIGGQAPADLPGAGRYRVRRYRPGRDHPTTAIDGWAWRPST